MSLMVIIKRDGTRTTPILQQQAKVYLLKPDLVDKDREANLSQVLNDIYSDRGKATSNYTYNGYPILHASSGNSVKSLTAFFYRLGGINYLVALGEHAGKSKGSESYKISVYGQATGDFKKNATILLD